MTALSPILDLVPGHDLETGTVTRDTTATPAQTVTTRTTTSPATAGLVHKIVALCFPCCGTDIHSLSPLIDK